MQKNAKQVQQHFFYSQTWKAKRIEPQSTSAGRILFQRTPRGVGVDGGHLSKAKKYQLFLCYINYNYYPPIEPSFNPHGGFWKSRKRPKRQNKGRTAHRSIISSIQFLPIVVQWIFESFAQTTPALREHCSAYSCKFMSLHSNFNSRALPLVSCPNWAWYNLHFY